MSSNFFFSTDPSASGQVESSWCTKMTFSSTASDTPMIEGTILSTSAHLYEMDSALLVPSLLRAATSQATE